MKEKQPTTEKKVAEVSVSVFFRLFSGGLFIVCGVVRLMAVYKRFSDSGGTSFE